MHNDFTNIKRDQFIYHYRGDELLPFARKVYLKYLRAEIDARELAAKLLTDMSVQQNDPKLVQAKNDIAHNGKIREQCAVWVHQFEKEFDREFPLLLGDVTFFGIAGDASEKDLADARDLPVKT